MAGELQLVGSPDAAILSTSTTLVPAPPRPAPVVHDVNGYYARLGVPTTATKRELREAYQALGGQNDAELTRIFKVLISTQQRAAYDAKQPGTTLIDQAAVEAIFRQAALSASRMNDEYGTGMTAREFLSTQAERTGNPLLQFLASGSPAGFDDDGTRDRHPSSNPPAAWPYAYLLLGSTCDDVARLAQWQEGLVHALADRGYPRFAVGFHAMTEQPFLVAKQQGIPLFFLHETAEVTGELIAAAANAA